MRNASEPRDEFYFDKYVINEDAGSIIDVDELVEGLEEDDEQYDLEREGDALTDAAMALLGGRRLNELTPEMRADVEKSLKAQGFLAENESLHDDAELEVQIEELDGDADPWLTEEVRVPVDMATDGRHAFTLTSDRSTARTRHSSTRRWRRPPPPLPRRRRPRLRLKPRCSRGWRRRKPRWPRSSAPPPRRPTRPGGQAREGRHRGGDGEPRPGDERQVQERRREAEAGRGDSPSPERQPPPTGANQWPPSPGKDKPSAAAGSDAPANPIEPPNGALSSDSVGSRLGKSKGERLFERLSAAASASAEATDAEYAESLDEEIDKMLSSKDFATSSDATDSPSAGSPGGGDGRVDPNAPANDAERHADARGEALRDADA